MTKYISLLRGINVGGHRKILMADLRALYEGLGLLNCTTYIQSGNAFFELKRKSDPTKLAAKIEKAIAEKYGFDVSVIVMTVETLEAAIAGNPYYKSDTEIERLILTFLKEEPTSEKLEKIKDFDHGDDKFEVAGKHVFIYLEGKYRDTKLSNKFFESKLKVAATTRNWKTVLKLSALAKTNNK